MYDSFFFFYFLFTKHSIVKKIVEDCVDNLLLKNSVQIEVDRLPWREEKIVVFRRKLENLLLVIAMNGYNAICYVASKHVQIK